MSLDDLKERLPDHAKDLRLNLSQLSSIASLSKRQILGVMLASAHAARHAPTLRAVKAAAAEHLDAKALDAAAAANAIMAMNNVYYRFVHLVSDKEYARLPAQLRMQVIANPGVDRRDFELFSLAVSAINGCGMCMDAHEKALAKDGATKAMVQDAVRIAAVIHAVAATLDAAEAAA